MEHCNFQLLHIMVLFYCFNMIFLCKWWYKVNCGSFKMAVKFKVEFFFIRNLSFIKFVFCLSLKYPQAWLFMLRKFSVFGISLKRGQWMFFFFFLMVTIISFIIDHVIYWVMWYSGHVMWCKHMIRVWFFSVMVHVLGYIMAIIMNVLYFCINKVCKLFFFICQIECLLLNLLFLLYLSSFLSQCL